MTLSAVSKRTKDKKGFAESITYQGYFLFILKHSIESFYKAKY